MKRISSPVIIVFVAAIVSVAWFTWSAWMSDTDSRHTNASIRQTSEKIRLLEQVAFQTRALESAVRGYVITGDTGFLGREDLSEARMRAPVESLAILTAGDAEATAQVDSLRTAVYERMVFSHYIVRTARESSVMAGAMIQSRVPVKADPLSLLTSRMLNTQYEQLEALTGPGWYDRLPFLLSIGGGIVIVLILTGGLFGIMRNVRKTREADAILRASEEKYRQLIEDAGVTLFTSNRGGYFTYVNSKALDLTGYTPKELENKHFTHLLDFPEQQELGAFYMNQAFDGDRETTKRFPIRRKNGEKRWVEQHVVLLRKNGIFSGYQCIVKDITFEKQKEDELKKAQKEMETLHERFESVLSNTPDIIFIKDTAGRYVLVNKRFQTTFAILPEQILGRTDRDFPDKLSAETSQETDRKVLLKEEMVEVEDMIVINGENRYFHIAKFPLRDPNGRVYGLCGVATDISQRIIREHELIDARRKAETAHGRMEHFMANMSHELRTPLNGILGFTNLLSEQSLIPEQKEYVKDIMDSAQNLLVLVNSLLDFSSIRAGKLHLEKSTFDPTGVIRQTVDQYGIRASEKGLRLECEMEETLKVPLLGDPTRLQQILHHLIDNAIKFTDQGAVKLAVKTAGTQNQNVTLRFSVSDTGIGIPENMKDKVGQVFTQLDEGDLRKYGGIGLGLALTRELIALHNGTIDVLDNPGGGTLIEFSISYPLDVPETIAETLTPVTDGLLLPPLSGKLILLAEDNLLNQKLALRTLSSAGATADLAETGAEAVAMYRQKPYDCILMDIQMPVMDGLEATRIIREAGSPIPIIALTACTLKGDRERCLLAGMNDYLSKPFIPKDLFQRILEVIGERFTDAAPFISEPWEEPLHPYRVDLRYLKSVAENDREYLLEVLQSFIDRTAGMLDNLLMSAISGEWDDVSRHASLLRSSLMVVRIHPLSDIVLQIEQDARSRSQLDMILPNIHLAINQYKEAQAVLEDEIRKL